MDQTVAAPLVGSWTYRSFHNNPTFCLEEDCKVCEDFRDLLFAQADLEIDDFAPGEFRGRLVFEEESEMALVGTSRVGDPFTIRFQGRGVTPGIEDWVYDCVGYLVPDWPNGVKQRPAITGSVVRTEPHGGGAEAGYVASWIAVRKD